MTVDANPFVTGVLGNPLHLQELSTNPATRADTGFLYTKDSAGITELFYKDSAGNVIQITTAGSAGGGDVAAQYLALATSATLTNERVFTPTTGLTAVDSGAGAAYTLTANLSTGVVGGQTATGGTAATNNLTLRATSHATDGEIVFLTDTTNEVARFGASEIGFNLPAANQDFRIEGLTDAALFFVDASADRIGIGTSSPGTKVDISQTVNGALQARALNASTGTGAVAEFTAQNSAGTCGVGVTSTGWTADASLAANEGYVATGTTVDSLVLLANRTSSHIRFHQRNSGGSLVETFRITAVAPTYNTTQFALTPSSGDLRWDADAQFTASRLGAHGTAVYPEYFTRLSRGTLAAPTDVVSADKVGHYGHQAYVAAAGGYIVVAGVAATVDGAISGAFCPTRLAWSVSSASASYFEAMRLDSNGVLSIKAGASADVARVGGTLFVSTTVVGNVGVGEDDLITYAVPASTLGTNGDSIWFEASGTFANTVANKRLRARFGTAGTNLIFDSGALAISAATDWTMRGRIIRTGAATQKAYVELNTSNATLSAYADVEIALDQTLSGAVTFKLTGEATNNDDVVNQTLIIGWHPNNT